ncbi:uncharacterized protein LOC124991635 [Sciurus carolinensis]|uniref:uncharacterized protein LOC124991635 n=1 Tax=Sciurus carolinensis TaxID=30640 RepID=UPI001FB319F2|nr:uncharacterized protein LOC124991635 [Sciurus carolinensis]
MALGGQREGGSPGSRAKTRGAGCRRRGKPAALTVWPFCPCAGLEPSRRRGAAALPCLVRLGRRPQQRSPRAAHRRAAAAPRSFLLGRGRSGKAGGVNPSLRRPAAATAPRSKSRPADCGRGLCGPRTHAAAGRLPDSQGSEPAARRFYPAWHRFHFISDEDVELSQKGHKSGQLALAPRRSSSTNFARASFAHSSTQVRNVTAHSVDGCETRRTQSPFDEIYMAHDASGLRCPGSQPPPAAPGRDPSPRRQRALCKLRGADKLKSEREGWKREKQRSNPGKPQPSEGWHVRFT